MICPECDTPTAQKSMVIDGVPGTYLLCGECFWSHRVQEEAQLIVCELKPVTEMDRTTSYVIGKEVPAQSEDFWARMERRW